MKVQIIDLANPLWMEILENIRHDVYHLPEYFQIEARRTKAIPEAIIISEDEKVFFAPYLLRQCGDEINSPLEDSFDIISPYGYPGILVSEAGASSSEFLENAIASFKHTLQTKGICSAFLRLHPILNEDLLKVCPGNIFTANGQTVSIDLKITESELWAHTRKGHQSTINKCKRLGFIPRMVSFEEYYDEFIAIYEETMNRVHASESYYFDSDYFRGLLNLGDKLHLCIIESEEEIICASLFFECCGIIQAHLGGTKNEFLSQSPFNLLLHHVRLWGRERGNEYLHIGGGIGGLSTDSLFTFKSGFSRQRHEFSTMRLIADDYKYFKLVELRAKELNKEVQELVESNFFPAYRV
jgi:hypothetical protein